MYMANEPAQFSIRVVKDDDGNIIKVQEFVSFRSNFKNFKMWRDVPEITLEESTENHELISTDGATYD